MLTAQNSFYVPRKRADTTPIIAPSKLFGGAGCNAHSGVSIRTQPMPWTGRSNLSMTMTEYGSWNPKWVYLSTHSSADPRQTTVSKDRPFGPLSEIRRICLYKFIFSPLTKKESDLHYIYFKRKCQNFNGGDGESRTRVLLFRNTLVYKLY